MPNSRPNTYMKKLKKSLLNNNGGKKHQFRSPRDPDQIESKKQKMRRFAQAADSSTNGYATMVKLNGGEAIGESDKKSIEKCIGIGSEVQASKTSPGKRSP